MTEPVPGQVSKEEAERLAREWQEQQDHASDIPPEGSGRQIFESTVKLPKVKIVKVGQPLRLHRPRDIGTPQWQEEKN